MKKKLPCIMLVDDDYATNLYHSIVIKEAGAADFIIEKLNGLEALAYLRSEPGTERPRPNLIFLDINMPRMNGWEFLDEYENLTPEQQGDHVIVMLSTSSNPDDIRRAQSNPFVKEYRDKPLTEKMLEDLIGRYWQKFTLAAV